MTCKGCGCPRDHVTPGCRTCYYRNYMRRRAAGLPTASTRPLSTAYYMKHERLWKARGKARDQMCWRHAELGIEVPATTWATIHGEDGMDPWADYVPLCNPCHYHYDREARKGQGKLTRGKWGMGS